MSKRIYLRALKAHDRATDDCTVRELEMHVDSVLTSPGYSIQFWRDAELYGVDEAILYVKNGNHGNAALIEAAWNQIKERLK